MSPYPRAAALLTAIGDAPAETDESGNWYFSVPGDGGQTRRPRLDQIPLPAGTPPAAADGPSVGSPDLGESVRPAGLLAMAGLDLPPYLRQAIGNQTIGSTLMHALDSGNDQILTAPSRPARLGTQLAMAAPASRERGSPGVADVTDGQRPRRSGTLARVSLRPVYVVFEAAGPAALARFWAEALGWVARKYPDEVTASPDGYLPDSPEALPLVFIPVAAPKTVKNRLHLDLATTSVEHQAAEVDRLLALGATRADIGQGDVPWEVMRDPEGNEFCVLDPRPEYLGTGPVAAVVIDSTNPKALAGFWERATSWTRQDHEPDWISLRSGSHQGPFGEIIEVTEQKTGRNRVHLDLAPARGGEHRSAARLLIEAGARFIEVPEWGGHSAGAMADPDGNEFCVQTAG
jgi:hypothetical protein